ncbi:IS66 family insertion sequence element accessory protein TnpB [Turicibacter bilis]|uniref:IS66 family insertion sequence element accessory protein TnpB n=1 Tax=Turicibacter bilis TaxID=2735723 RepID=A0A9Q9CRB4_9FIRM|nr:IS66 family insertion sequence element accessory protein TnpB [Turicibacter bilis]UUF08333.1 IS66 family insertion sequence element accessory protein TnpB [Turicibacter bilis]
MCSHTDIGCGIHGLAGLIAGKYNLNLFNDALFLFCNRKKHRFKALYWDKDSFILVYRRIEKGHLEWPQN